MALPKDIEALPRDKWLELAKSADAANRKKVTDVLRAIGMAAPDYMSLDAEARVELVMKAQGDAAAEKGAAGKDSNKKDKDTTASSGSGGGGGMTAADRALLKGVDEKLTENNQLLRKVHDLLVVQIFSGDGKAKANAEEMDVEVKLLGNG